MAVSAIGKVYARRVHDGDVSAAEIPSHRLETARDSYMELYGEPMPEAA